MCSIKTFTNHAKLSKEIPEKKWRHAPLKDEFQFVETCGVSMEPRRKTI